MYRMIKGIFSSSIPTSSNVVKEEEVEEELDSDAQADLQTPEHSPDQQIQDRDATHADAETHTRTMDPPSSMVNRTPKVANGEPATLSAVKGSKKKKNKAKEGNEARRIKNQKKKERKKRKKRDALDSSVMDSSVMGDDVEARGFAAEDDNDVKEESFVSLDLSRTMSNLFGDEPARKNPEAPKPKKAKKPKGPTKKHLVAQAAAADKLASQKPEDFAPIEVESQDLQALIRKEQLATRKEKKSAKATTAVESESSGSQPAEPNLVEKAKKTRQKAGGFESSASVSRSQSAERSLAEKIKSTKQKALLSPRKPSQESIAALQDEDDPEALLHQPLTPALFNHSKPQSPIQPTTEDVAEAETQIQSNAWSTGQVDPVLEDDDEEPARPSKKALGKRKMSNSTVQSNAKRRKPKDKAETTAKLTDFGFVASNASSDDAENPLSRECSLSVSHETAELARTAASLYASQMELERTSPIPDIPASPSLPIHSSQQRRSTTAFTPVNSGRPLEAVVIPAPTNYPFELPPSSQPRPASKPELPQKAPTSTERRKRRLPTGEPESSQAKEAGRITREGRGVVAKRAVKSMTPKSSASKVKIPKTKTSKTPASSQATTATKGSRLPAEDIKAITDAVESYRDDNDLREVDLNSIIQGEANKNRAKEFWAYMYEAVPDVPNSKVLNHCRRNFHNFKARGSWTEEADQDLRDAHERNPGKWRLIGAELNRFSEDCRDRWRNYLICGGKQRKDAWDKEEEETLREIVEKLQVAIRKGEKRKSTDVRKDGDARLDWLKVSEMMGHTRSRLQCTNKWKQIREREDEEVEDPVATAPVAVTQWRLENAEKIARKMKPSDKLDLLYHIRDSKAGSEGKIPWVQIQQDLGVKSRRMAFRVCYRHLKEHILNSEYMKVQNVVSTLIDLYEAAAPAEPQGFNHFFPPTRDKKFGKRKSSFGSVSGDDDDGDDEEDEESDENNTVEPPSRAKKERTSQAKSEEDNGEGPSTQKPRLHLAKGRKAAMLSEMEHDNGGTPPKKSAKKLRSRMKKAGQKGSQETIADPVESADDIGAAFQAVKSSQGRLPRVAKKPIMAANTSRRSKHLSAIRVIDSDSEAEPVIPEEQPTPKLASRSPRQTQLDDEAQPDEEMPQDDEEQPYLDLPHHEQEIPESDINMDEAPPINGNLESEFEEDEDYPSNTHDQESVDLDHVNNTTTNGFHNDISLGSADEESVDDTRFRSESPDQGTVRKPLPDPMTHFENDVHNDDDESDVGIGPACFQRSTSMSSDGVSSDASSIPHTQPARAR